MTKIITDLMTAPLPSKNKQRKLVFRPTRELANQTYAALNNIIFDNKLNPNPTILFRSFPKQWGWCHQHTDDKDAHYCKIRLIRRFYCSQWFTTVLAHEMCHVYEWEVLRIEATHAAEFFMFKDALRSIGIPLEEAYCTQRWFKYQNILDIGPTISA